jgi:CheY-like chemotaxis protein
MATWLIVEDEQDIHDVLLLVAEVLRHRGLAFSNGEEVCAWIDAIEGDGGAYPDLALIDMRLPGAIQGEQIAARLRRSPLLGRIPIILMTGYYLPPDMERDLLARSGADRILQKPLPSPLQLDTLFRSVQHGRMQQQ